MVVPLAGGLRVDHRQLPDDVQTSTLLEGRSGVFEGPTDVLYLGAGTSLTITVDGDGDGRVAVARGRDQRAPSRAASCARSEVPVEIRGGRARLTPGPQLRYRRAVWARSRCSPARSSRRRATGPRTPATSTTRICRADQAERREPYYFEAAPARVKPLFTNTIVNQGDNINIDIQVKRTDESVVNGASVTITIYDPSSNKLVTGGTMTYVTDSDGVYQYAYTVPAVNGSYLYDVTATAGSDSGSGAGNFQVGTMASDIKTISSVVSGISTDLGAVSSSLSSLIGTLSNNLGAVSSSLSSLINGVNTNVVSANSALATMSGTLGTLGTSLTDASSSLGSLIGSLSDNLTSVSSSLSSLIGGLSTSLADTSSSLGALISGVNANVNSTNNALGTISNTVNTISGNLTNTSSTLGTLITGVNTNVNNANSALGTISDTLSSLSGNLVGASSSLTSLINGLGTSIADASSSLGALIDGVNNNLTGDTTSLGGLIDGVNTSVNNVSSTLGAVSSAVNNLGTALADTSSSLSSLISGVNTNVNSANSALGTISDALNTLGTTVTNTSSSLGSLITSNTSNLNSAITSVNTSVNTSISNLASSVNTNVNTGISNVSSSLSSQIQQNTAQLNTLSSNVDILIGAFIVTQSTVNDPAPSSTRFVTNLTNPTSDFYTNSVITFTSGALNGQVRRVSGYDGATKALSVDPALTQVPVSGDAFTITKQNVYAQAQLTSQEASNSIARANIVDIQSKITDVQTKVTDIQGKTNSMYSLLQTVDTNLDNLQSSVNTIRASQQKVFSATLSDTSALQAGNTYRATITVLDFESNPIDLASVPAITIYDSSRNAVVTAAAMSRLSTGVYEYDYPVDSAATGGSWESVVSVDTGGSAPKVLNDYFAVASSPAQVIVNSITTGVPTVTANISIKNEGTVATEYQYAYCIVANQTDACGGNTNVAYGSAAKLIAVGDTFTTDIPLTISAVGTYWFKITATYGGESSSASQQFTVASAQPATLSGGIGGVLYNPVTLTTVDQDVLNLSSQIQNQSAQIAKTLALIGNVDPTAPGFKSLLAVSSSTSQDIASIQNKISDLKAVSSLASRVLEQGSLAPVVETYMKFNSVEIDFLISNPSPSAQVVNFKSFLPEEATPEIILDSSGLKVDYDVNAKTYFVSGDISLGPKQTVVKKVEMQDIWVFDQGELSLLKGQADDLANVLKGTQYESQSLILKDDVESTIGIVLSTQADSYKSPQDHIVAYRDNLDRVNKVKDEITQLKNLVTQADAAKSIVGNIGGVQTVATWGVIVAVVFGFALLAAVVFALWRYQMKAMALLLGNTTYHHRKLKARR